MRYFTSDTHFSLMDYAGTVQRDFRPFRSCKQMNRTIIRVWNRQAKRGDTIYHLGDFSNYNSKDRESYKTTNKLVKKIKADVILILGNNEERVVKEEFDGDFQKFRSYLIGLGFKDVIQTGLEIEIDGIKFYLNHYPVGHKEGVINLFGHIHTSAMVKRYGFNVGIDNHYLGLFSEKDIIRLVGCMKYYDDNVYN